MPPETDPAASYRVALRGAPQLDDVVVNDVAMFRAEMLNEGHLWVSCYLNRTGVAGDRITFEVVARGGRLDFQIGERPQGSVSYETNE